MKERSNSNSNINSSSSASVVSTSSQRTSRTTRSNATNRSSGTITSKKSTRFAAPRTSGKSSSATNNASSHHLHADRPRFESALPKASRTRRIGGIPMLHDDLSYSKVGVGIVWRDADSSQRALAELAKKRQRRLERKRAAGLLLMLIMLAVSVHIVTHVDRNNGPNGPSGGSFGGGLKSARTKKYGGASVDYGANGGSSSTKDGEARENDGDMTDGEGGDGESSSNSTEFSTKNVKTKDSSTKEIKLNPNVADNFVSSAEQPKEDQIPFFFHVPRSAGQTILGITGKCLKLVLASDMGVREGHAQDEALQQVEMEGIRYVNVDTTSLPGLERSKELGLAGSKMMDMVTSSYFLPAAEELFSSDNQGRAFMVMRSPIERAVSMYYFKRSSNDIDETVSLEDYGQGNGIENNWMVRFLTNRMEGELKLSHLDEAKEVLKQKFLVGFIDDFEESIIRMMKYHGWEYDDDEEEQREQQECIQDFVKDGSNPNPYGEYEVPKKGTQAHALIAWQTQYDMKLYEYAKILFEKQTKQYGSKQRKKELKKKLKEGKETTAQA